ncbi:PepSY domain-containing protein [Nesterenkonia sandarakina]|uniref:Putative membrane protein YkoI n=1 Tax=Nesterenkonia sandarakina TaxID=272918 RepID=A0A2T0YGV4_9MICC|nr:PepSY domain-containing protein [Nesterenkonia sandarakina]PRZ14225.1 putative membrane protein YkoI [Nesterenkonia sandarakina]
MSNLRSKRVLVPAIAAVTVTAVGAGAWTAIAQTDDVRGSERDQVVAAVADAVADGQVTDVETSDDRGVTYEVEVRLPDGSEVDLALDADFAVVSREADDRDDNDDDRVPAAGDRQRAEQAALEAVGSGTATDVEASDDRGVTYEVEVVDADGVEWHVDLDAAFDVVDQRQDR